MLKRLTSDAKLPTKGSKYSAGIDVYASEDVVIGAGEAKLVPLGIAIDFDFILHEIGGVTVSNDGEVHENNSSEKIIDFMKSHYIQLSLRSSLALKGLMLANGVGIIDFDYKDEIKMIVHYPYSETIYKVNDKKFKIKKGDKVGQLIVLPHRTYLTGVESVETRTGGFGSTGG